MGKRNVGGNYAVNTPISLRPSDKELVKAVQRHFGDDSFSKAIRRSVEMVARLSGIAVPRDDERTAA